MTKVMLCQPGEPFNSDYHLFEPKLDGIRMLREQRSGVVRLWSRYGRDITAKFPELCLPSSHDHLIDGEAIVLGPEGMPCLHFILKRMTKSKPTGIRLGARLYPAQYWAFDMLKNNQTNMEDKTLINRKRALARWDKPPNCDIVPFVIGEGLSLFRDLTARGCGLIAKELDSPYLRGRSHYWIKCTAVRARSVRLSHQAY